MTCRRCPNNSERSVGLCETKLSDDTANIYKLPNYNFYTNNVSSDKGGVCLYIKNKLACIVRSDLCVKKDHFESIFVECRPYVANKKLIIGMIYRRPGTPQAAFQQDLDSVLNKIDSPCILMGDYNINLLNENNDNSIANFANNLREKSFTEVILKPTRVHCHTATLIDHMWVNFSQSMNHKSRIIFSDVSDHFPTVYFYHHFKCNRGNKVIEFREKKEQNDIKFKERIDALEFRDIYETGDANEAFDKFNEIMIREFNLAYPLVTKTINENKTYHPWLTPGLKESIKMKNRMYKKFVKHPITYGPQYRMYRNNLTKLLKISKNNYYLSKFEESKSNIKANWKNINHILGKGQQNQQSIFKINNSHTCDVNIISNAFNDYYATIGKETSKSLPTSNKNFKDYLTEPSRTNINWTEVTIPEVKRMIKQCKNTKPGPDNIPIKIFKNNLDTLAPVLTYLFNLSLNQGVFPTVHKLGKIIPLYKSKEMDEIKNYRPICLLNSISKILEKVVSTRLMKHLEENNILSNNQFAYRKGKSTELAITEYVKNVMDNLANNNITISVFLDLTRAFDCVDHDILLAKLEHYGVKNEALNWFKTYLKDRRQYVFFKNKTSNEKICNIGVPQGSILGPILFLTYINDLSNATQIGDLFLFADDATYSKSGNNVNILIKEVNQNLKKLREWFITNKLSINLIKTESMLHTRKNIYFPLPPILLNEVPIPYNYTLKFLGVILDFKLTWKAHIQTVQKKLSSACGIFYNIRNKITKDVAKAIYYAIVYPYLHYCNIVWGGSYQTSLNRINITQKKLVRCIMRQRRDAPSNPLFKQLKLLKFDDILKLDLSTFVFKTINHLIITSVEFNARVVGPYNLRNVPPLEVPFARNRHTQMFIPVRGAMLWNSLPENITRSQTLFSFKKKVKLHYLSQYDN